jgi:hypothetical protein
MNALQELDMPFTNTALLDNNTAPMDIAYNHKKGDQSKYIDVIYHKVHNNYESGWISLLEVKSDDNLGDICTKGCLLVTLRKLRTVIIDAKLWLMLDFGGYFIILLFHCRYSF